MDSLINFPLGNAKKKNFHTNFFRPLLKENGYLKNKFHGKLEHRPLGFPYSLDWSKFLTCATIFLFMLAPRPFCYRLPSLF